MCQFIYIGNHSFMMREVMINIGSIIAIAVTAALLYIKYVKPRQSNRTIIQYMVFPMAIEAIIALVFGAALGILIRSVTYEIPGNFIEKITYSIKYGGTHFIGTVLVSAIVLPIFCYVVYEKNEGRQVLNTLAFFFPIQHICNRIGCFLEGCCYGIPMNGIFSVKFPDEIVPYRVFPSQLFEIFCMIVLLLLQIILYKKQKDIFIVTMAGFGISIFISEFFMDKAGVITYCNLDAIQMAALLLLVIAFILFCIKKKLFSEK